MEMVASQRADVTMLEAGDVYRAGKGYGLVPIMSEVRKIALVALNIRLFPLYHVKGVQFLLPMKFADIQHQGVQPWHR